MLKFISMVAAMCFLTVGLCVVAVAGCGKDCNKGAGSMACKDAGEVEVLGKVKSVDADKGVVVLSPDDASGDTSVVVDKDWAGKLKPGDTITVKYEKKETNVATHVQKHHSGYKRPGPCTDKKKPE